MQLFYYGLQDQVDVGCLSKSIHHFKEDGYDYWIISHHKHYLISIVTFQGCLNKVI